MSKRYYWLKLQEGFFEDETIRYIEDQENGIEYVNFYLKLCLKSLKSDGKLIRLIGETLIPYDVKSLSKLTGVDVDTVRVAMALFEKIGLVKIFESGEIYLSQIDELIGKETDKAKIMRAKRARELTGNNVTETLPECYTENRDKSIEIRDIEEDKDINNISPPKEPEKPQKPEKHKYGEYKHVLLTDEEYKKLHQDYSNADELITYLDEYIEMKGYKANSHNLAIRKWVTKAVAKEKAEDSRRHEFKEPAYDDSNNIKATSDELEALKRMRGEI